MGFFFCGKPQYNPSFLHCDFLKTYCVFQELHCVFKILHCVFWLFQCYFDWSVSETEKSDHCSMITEQYYPFPIPILQISLIKHSHPSFITQKSAIVSRNSHNPNCGILAKLTSLLYLYRAPNKIKIANVNRFGR